MNAEPENNLQPSAPAPAKLQPKKWLQSLPKRLLKLVTHNWGWKVLAVLLALCLWAGLITQDPTLTRERVFGDVKVSVTGSDTLRRNGMIVLSGLEDEALVTRLRVDVPQREYNSASATNFNPRVELSRVTETGEQTLKIITTSTTTYGTVQSLSPDSVSVVVDQYVTNYRVPVTVNIIGEYPQGYYGATPTADPSVVAVSGPKSIVDQIARVYVDFDVSKLIAREGLSRSALGMRFADAGGNAVESDLLEATSSDVLLRTIIVQQQLYPSKALPVSTVGVTVGTVAQGYHIASVDITPASVLTAGESGALEALESIAVATPLDVTGLNQSFAAEVRLDKPIDLNYLNVDEVLVSVTIEPVSVTRTFADVRLRALNASDAYDVTLNENTVTVQLTGAKNIVEALKASAVSAYVDASGLAAGEYSLPVYVQVENADMTGMSSLSSLGTVGVTLTQKP